MNSLLSDETRLFRSRLNQLPIELKMQIGELPFQKGVLNTHKRDRAKEILSQFNDIDWIEIGTGTNRFIIKYEGYVIKIALDKEGVADNKQEWVMSEMLAPDVAKAYEVSKGGNFLVAAYCPAFTSLNEMYMYSQTIRDILKRWGQRYLLGDVGITELNFANWGLSPDGKPVCIDYAYIFPAAMKLFKCICGNENLSFADSTFSAYRCPKCGHRYADAEIRQKISQQERLKLFNEIQGITMTEAKEYHKIENKYVNINNNPDAPDLYETALAVEENINFGL